MVVINGKAKKVRTSLEINGGGKDGDVSISHVSMFLLGKKQVYLKSSEPHMINENDLVSVAGKVKRGAFRGYAYKNATTSASGHAGFLVAFLFGLILPSAGVFCFIAFSDPFFGFAPKIIGAIFIGVGFCIFYQAAQVLKAKNLLRSDE